MTNEKAIEQLKIARCAFSTPEMRGAFNRAIEALQAEPCVKCRRQIAEHICDLGEKDQSYNAGYSDGYHRAMLDYGLEDDIKPEEIEKAIKALQGLIDQRNDDDSLDVYTDDEGNRFYYLDDRDFKAIREAITVLLDKGRQEPPLVPEHKWDRVKDAAEKLI